MSLLLADPGLHAKAQLYETAAALEGRYHLTEREMELVKAVSFYGYNNKELADVLHISEKTVKNHLANIMRKTETRSSRELLALILRASLDKIFNHTGGKWSALDTDFPI